MQKNNFWTHEKNETMEKLKKFLKMCFTFEHEGKTLQIFLENK